MSKILTHLGAWTAVPNQVLTDCQLSKSARLVYYALLSFARPDRGKMTVWPGIEKLSKETGYSESSVKRGIAELLQGIDGHRGPLIARERRIEGSSITLLLNPSGAYYPRPGQVKSDLTSGHGRADGQVTSEPREEDVVEEDVVTACVPSPRTTCVEIDDEYLTKKELARRKRDEVLGQHKPPKEQKVPPRAKIGAELARLWDRWIAFPLSVPGVASMSPTSMSAAARTFEALCDTAWRELSPTNIIFKVVEKIKACDPAVRKTITFEMLFVSKAENLPKLLNGNWQAARSMASETTGWGKDIL